MTVQNRLTNKKQSSGQGTISSRSVSSSVRQTRHGQVVAGIGAVSSRHAATVPNHAFDDSGDDLSIDATVHTFGSLATDHASLWSC